MNLSELQHAIAGEHLDGWLFFDHHQRDALAYGILGLPIERMTSRRWYYFIPATGEPRKLVHKVEPSQLDALPGSKTSYAGWEEQRHLLSALLEGSKRVAMQYSPDCSVPYVAMVDAGTIELVRGLGVEVMTSANLVQYFQARWTSEQLESHLEAGRRVDAILSDTFRMIGDRIRSGVRITEWDAQEHIKQSFAAQNLFADHGPNVSVNAHSSDPHYDPKPGSCAEIRTGDNVLIDLWAKLDQPGAVYYDITWMGYCGATPPSALQNIFAIVKGARERATRRVLQAVASGESLCGYQVDDAAREYIREQGFADYFYHRTGHSIGTEVHGTGANMDNLETHDDRRVIPWTCFSIEPGIYLPEFGVRSEVNVFVGEDEARVTGAIQEDLVII
jgi:Xaa-Pro aminopeptidase